MNRRSDPEPAREPVWELGVDLARLDPGVPERLDRPPDVLGVGGGVVGLATAALCRRAGLGRVLVVERGRLASGPSGRGEGIMRPEPRSWAGAPPEGFTAFAWRSLALWRALDQDWGGALGVTSYDWFETGTGDGPPSPLLPGATLSRPRELPGVDPCLPAGTGRLLVRGFVRGREDVGGRATRSAYGLAARAEQIVNG